VKKGTRGGGHFERLLAGMKFLQNMTLKKTLKGLKGTNVKRRSEAKFSDNCLKKKWMHNSNSGSTLATLEAQQIIKFHRLQRGQIGEGHSYFFCFQKSIENLKRP
jgi:hypothetical protein